MPAFAAGAQSRTASPILPELDRFVRALVDRAPPTALAVAVVRGDSVVHLAAYGTMDSARTVPATTDAAWYMGSSTKSFVALTAALLAARGTVDLDAPITRYLPDFRLPAPHDVARITLRKLLSHRGGFESGPVSFRVAYGGDLRPDSILPLLARTAVVVDSNFRYSNTQYVVAALALARVTDRPWQDLVAREVLRPLGLERTSARMSEARTWPVVVGYRPGPGGFRIYPSKPDVIMHAAGGMVMSIEDATIWLRAQLGKGRVGGKQVLPEAVVAGTHRQLSSNNSTFDHIQRFGYGLGWQLGISDGDTLHHHFGNYPGAFAHISFIASKGVGVAVFMNNEMPIMAPLPGVIARRSYDIVLGRRDRDALYATVADSIGSKVVRMYDAVRADLARRGARPKTPPLGWEAFVGRYAHPNFGEFAVVTAEGSAELRFAGMISALEVFSGDTLRFEVPPGQGTTLAPVIGADGRVEALRFSGTSFVRVK